MIPELNTTMKSLQKMFNILDSSHLKNTFSIKLLTHDLLLIALVMSFVKKVY